MVLGVMRKYTFIGSLPAKKRANSNVGWNNQEEGVLERAWFLGGKQEDRDEIGD